MARSTVPGEAPNFDAINLARVLARLEPKIAGKGSRLQHSSIERAKTTANLEYARTLLLRLEHSTSQLKAAPSKRAAQATLQEQRALLKRLTERLYDLGHAENEKDDFSEEGEDILLQLAPPPPPPPPQQIQVTEIRVPPREQTAPPKPPPKTPPKSTSRYTSRYAPASASPASPTASPPQPQTQPSYPGSPPPAKGPTSPPPPPPPAAAPAAGAARVPPPPSGLRARNTRDALLGDAASRAATATGRETAAPPSKEKDLSAATATQLQSADAEQSQLTESMLELAAALKKSARSFASELDADKETVGRTEDALDRNRSGMDATSSRMAKLRKMSEGRWFATRVGMMILIPVLWVVLLLQVFVFPKLRF